MLNKKEILVCLFISIFMTGCGAARVTLSSQIVEKENRQPIEGVMVKLFEEGKEFPIDSVLTDEDGDFYFELENINKRQNYKLKYYKPFLSDMMEKEVNFGSNQPIKPQLRLDSLKSCVIGTIKNDKDHIVSDADIYLIDGKINEQISYTFSNALGEFFFELLEPGEYSLQIDQTHHYKSRTALFQLNSGEKSVQYINIKKIEMDKSADYNSRRENEDWERVKIVNPREVGENQ
jgi:hypothetical protein